MRLKGKTCLVTGGTAGIGLEIAKRFLEEGADVHVIGRNPRRGDEVLEEFERSYPERRAWYHRADVSITEDIKALAHAIGEPLHVLVNNAATLEGRGTVLDMPEDTWERIIRTNLTSVFLVSKYLVPSIIRSGGGCIINLSSRAGLVGRPQSPAYCAAKAGIINLTRQMALDFARYKVRVNCISPGKIATRGVEEVVNTESELGITDFILSHPLEMTGPPSAVAEAALYLATEDSGMANGVNLVIDAGTTVCM